ncbi:MAG: hypothetical protein ACRYG8_44775, partial [Janthinobacterium lividum]
AEKKTLNFLYPVALSSNQEISVTIHTKLFRGMSDSEVFFSSVPCMDLRLEVHRCEKLARIGASAIHRAELQLESESSDGREMVWALRSAVLPAQGVYVWWRNE